MWIDCTGGKLLECFENMMAKIMLPALKSQEVGSIITLSWLCELSGIGYFQYTKCKIYRDA